MGRWTKCRSGAEDRPRDADLEDVRGGELALPKRESKRDEARLIELGKLGSVAEGVRLDAAAASLAGSLGASKALGAGGMITFGSARSACPQLVGYASILGDGARAGRADVAAAASVELRASLALALGDSEPLSAEG